MRELMNFSFVTMMLAMALLLPGGLLGGMGGKAGGVDGPEEGASTPAKSPEGVRAASGTGELAHLLHPHVCLFLACARPARTPRALPGAANGMAQLQVAWVEEIMGQDPRDHGRRGDAGDAAQDRPQDRCAPSKLHSSRRCRRWRACSRLRRAQRARAGGAQLHQGAVHGVLNAAAGRPYAHNTLGIMLGQHNNRNNQYINVASARCNV